MTWMNNNQWYLDNASDLYSSYHATYGDDIQASQQMVAPVSRAFSWYRPVVSVEGAGRERNIPGLQSLGENAFWGITWNSSGIDMTQDMGAPWGAYCADPTSYKRPSPTGNCSLVALEWTARDLTRAYFTQHEEYYSTDPDDILLRAQFDQNTGSTYIRAIVDAYAAAGQTQPLVMVTQQETAEEALNPMTDGTVLAAMYDEAKRSGMQIVTLSNAATQARNFSAQPRAIAFPFIAGGYVFPGNALNASTIDFHDNVAGMTFVAGHTTPSRVFVYANYPASNVLVPLPQLSAANTPVLTSVLASAGVMTFHFRAPIAVHYGVAIWSDPAMMGWLSPNIVPAGHAGAVAWFDLPAGDSDVALRCTGCTSTTLNYAQ